MRTTRQLLCTIALLIVSIAANAQDNKAKAKEIGMAAIKLEDENKPDEALPLLKQAQELDPENYVYTYEMAYCYRMKKEFKQGIAVMNKIMNLKDIREECYQMLGNLYDLDGDSVMALNSYAAGLKRFPNAGRLYLETGNIYLIRKQYMEALPYYEKGIEVDPGYPSNYYRAAQLYTSSTEPIWGMIYGEIFMNLERNSDRTADMSKWLYDTYKSAIVIHAKDSMEVHFCKSIMEIDDKTVSDLNKGKELRMPFSMLYETTTLLALISVEAINTESLCGMRKRFIDLYYEKDITAKRQNVLFEYQHEIEKAGHLDAYNHWILMKGDEDAFTKWQDAHKKEWDDFVTWFSKNQLELTPGNVFLKSKA